MSWQNLYRWLICCLQAFWLGFSPLCQAELHGTLTLTTNNAFRWYSKNHNRIAAQANIDYQHDNSGLYLGATASNVDFSDPVHTESAQVEVIPYLGWHFTLPGKWQLDTQWSRYLYDGKLYGHNADYNEFYLFLHYGDVFTGRFSGTEDYYGTGRYALDYELTGRYPITDSVEFSVGFGYSQTSAALGSDYPYWNIGLSYFYKAFSFDLRYMDAGETNIDHEKEAQLHGAYDPVVLDAACVFSVSMGF
jgi:uncharacterized protein (TIGR02001 family)